MGIEWVLYDGQYGFRPEYSCRSKLVTVCQNIWYSLHKELSKATIIINFSKDFYSVPHDRLLTKIAATGVGLRVVVWIKEFLFGRSQRVGVHVKL